MKKPVYLYIDDEDLEALEPIRDGFNDEEKIHVEILNLEKGSTFDDVKELIRVAKFDGIILDLRLDGNGPNRVNFSAPTIAQDLRTMSARGELKSFPIILCSTLAKIRETYSADRSSHDLFDYKFEKSDNPNYEKFSQKLYSLAIWYQEMNASEFDVYRSLNRKLKEGVDSRIYEHFFYNDKNTPYDYANFIVNELFHHPGALIKEKTLAARLGINIDSSEDWENLKTYILSETKYNGLFCDGWERWWSDLVINWFKGISDGLHLSNINAERRTRILKDKTGLQNLNPATPIEHCTSSEFWTVCEGLKRPLDPLEGFVVYEKNELKPWQENKYISFQAAEVERIGRERGLMPHPMEKDKIEFFKSTLE